MKLRQLQCLCAVVDAGFNISRAAAVLHATQPAVGKQLRLLEEELGVDLVLRQRGRPVALTEAGERTIVWARRALQSAENIKGAARQTRGGETEGRIVLATSHTLARYLLLPAIVAFTKAQPSVRISIKEALPQAAVQMVRDGTVTIGVTQQPREQPAEVVSVPFQTLELGLVAPAAHALLRVRELTLEKIAGYPMITQHVERAQGERVARKFADAGLTINARVESLDTDVIKTYVAAGLGVAIIPKFAYDAAADRKLRVRDASHLFEASVAAVVLKRDSHLADYVYTFLETLDATLVRRRIEAMVFGAST